MKRDLADSAERIYRRLQKAAPLAVVVDPDGSVRSVAPDAKLARRAQVEGGGLFLGIYNEHVDPVHIESDLLWAEGELQRKGKR